MHWPRRQERRPVLFVCRRQCRRIAPGAAPPGVGWPHPRTAAAGGAHLGQIPGGCDLCDLCDLRFGTALKPAWLLSSRGRRVFATCLRPGGVRTLLRGRGRSEVANGLRPLKPSNGAGFMPICRPRSQRSQRSQGGRVLGSGSHSSHPNAGLSSITVRRSTVALHAQCRSISSSRASSRRARLRRR